MFRLLKVGLLAVLAYAIATAAPTQQAAMLEGARALGEAVVDTCTRDGSPCQRAMALLQVVTHHPAK
jgi:hypothetical protein